MAGNDQPIAMFDSGVGGLTVLHECLVSLPEEDFVYLGDDARFPYGARTAEELRSHVEQVSRFLLGRGAKLLVIACNSATSAGLETAREVAAEHGVEVVSVIEPEAEIAAAVTDNGKVGVLATPATVRSGAYGRALRASHRPLTVTEVEAPALAAVIQRGFPFDQSVVEMVRTYCEPLRQAEVDTVILGCTHYPLVARCCSEPSAATSGSSSAGHAIASTVQRVLAERGLESTRKGEGDYGFVCTEDPEAFQELGTRFLQMPLSEVELNVNGTVFFQASDGTNGVELWKSDGMLGGTMMAPSAGGGINPAGADSRPPTAHQCQRHTVLRGQRRHKRGRAVEERRDAGRHCDRRGHRRGWRTNPAGGYSFPNPSAHTSTASSSSQADDGTNGVELWKSDGTPSGTTLVEDSVAGGGINPGNGNSFPGSLNNVNGTLFFCRHRRHRRQ